MLAYGRKFMVRKHGASDDIEADPAVGGVGGARPSYYFVKYF